MLDKDNKYTKMQRDFYNETADIMAIDNHRGHDSNPDYYGILLGDITADTLAWSGKTALDFGCGIGRNVDNLLKSAPFKRVDGCDISQENIIRAGKFLQSRGYAEDKYTLHVTDGVSLKPIKARQYDFVMATIVLQHIAVYSIRRAILEDIFRVMKKNGIFSFQMVKHNGMVGGAGYYDEAIDAPGTNGRFDVSVDDANDVIKDLNEIGFGEVSYEVKPEWEANQRQYMSTGTEWIYFRTTKP